MEGRARLDSWKEIATYLGRDVRTVIRWQERGLPVYRLPGGKLPRVFAYPDELDRWLSNGVGPEGVGEEPPAVASPGLSIASRPVWLTFGIAVVALSTAAALFAWTRATRPIAKLSTARGEVTALDTVNRPLWSYRVEGAEIVPQLLRWSWIGDLDADGREDALAALQVRTPPSNEFVVELSRFSATGARAWTRSLDDRITFGAGTFGPPWVAADLNTYRVDGEVRVAWSVHHFTWWPGMLVTLDAAGRRLGTFVNAGWIRGVDPSPDERHLLAAGVSNNQDSYFLAVLDAARPDGRSPEPPGSATECRSCPEGHPLQYVVFPRTDVSVSRHQPFPAAGPTLTTRADGSIDVHVLSSASPNIADTIYELALSTAKGSAGPYTLRRVTFSDSHWEWHRRLEAEGWIDHPAAACPERAGLDVLRWTSAEGWSSLRVAVR